MRISEKAEDDEVPPPFQVDKTEMIEGASIAELQRSITTGHR